MSHVIGTLAWIDETKGFVSRAESRAMLLKVIRAQLSVIPDEWLHKVGLKRPRDLNVEFAAIAPPDTEAVKRARVLSREYLAEYMFNHLERSYYWARFGVKCLSAEPRRVETGCLRLN